MMNETQICFKLSEKIYNFRDKKCIAWLVIIPNNLLDFLYHNEYFQQMSHCENQ